MQFVCADVDEVAVLLAPIVASPSQWTTRGLLREMSLFFWLGLRRR